MVVYLPDNSIQQSRAKESQASVPNKRNPMRTQRAALGVTGRVVK